MLASGVSAIVPYGADQTMYVVIDNAAAPGSARREVECADFDTVAAELLDGSFGDPMQVVAFNTLEHWSRDLSVEVANEIQARCDSEPAPVPEYLRDFVGRYTRALVH